MGHPQITVSLNELLLWSSEREKKTSASVFSSVELRAAQQSVALGSRSPSAVGPGLDISGQKWRRAQWRLMAHLTGHHRHVAAQCAAALCFRRLPGFTKVSIPIGPLSPPHPLNLCLGSWRGGSSRLVSGLLGFKCCSCDAESTLWQPALEKLSIGGAKQKRDSRLSFPIVAGINNFLEERPGLKCTLKFSIGQLSLRWC